MKVPSWSILIQQEGQFDYDLFKFFKVILELLYCSQLDSEH